MVRDSLFLRGEDKSLNSEKQFPVCQRTEREVDRWEDEGGEDSVSRRQLGGEEV